VEGPVTVKGRGVEGPTEVTGWVAERTQITETEVEGIGVESVRVSETSEATGVLPETRANSYFVSISFISSNKTSTELPY
jgi:hypothetical protein